MSVASYEGPASRNEVGDQRFIQTLALRGAAVQIPIGPEIVQPSASTMPDQLKAAGAILVQQAEIE